MAPSPQALGFGRRYITLWKSTGQDALGQPSQTPVKVLSTRATIVGLKGAELVAASQVNAQVYVKITVRYGSVRAIFEDGSLATMYVQDRNSYYDIQGLVSRDQRDQWVDLTCISRLGQPPIFS